MNRFNKSYVTYDKALKDARKAFATSEGFAYYCPYCYDKEVANGVRDPKPDSVGKLYINETEKCGFCFRCNTVVRNKTDDDCLKLRITDNEGADAAALLHSLPTVDLSQIPFAYENEEAMAYLLSRNKSLTPKAVKSLGLRWIDRQQVVSDCIEGSKKIRRMGILVPLVYHGQIRSYQIRYITNDHKRRFYTMEGKKILGVIKEVPKFDNITIAEGFYDAVALAFMGFPNPVALLGKTPSSLQLAQLKELAPCHINLCLDESPLNYNMMWTLKRALKTAETFEFWSWQKYKDPEEFFAANPGFKYVSKFKNRPIIRI